MQLADFVAHPHSREAALEEPHVLALRLYTTAAFLALTAPLRDVERYERGEAHPMPVTVAFLAEAVRRLRAVGAQRPEAQAPLSLYRGLANRTATTSTSFMQDGGTEVGLLSSGIVSRAAL